MAVQHNHKAIYEGRGSVDEAAAAEDAAARATGATTGAETLTVLVTADTDGAAAEDCDETGAASATAGAGAAEAVD